MLTMTFVSSCVRVFLEKAVVRVEARERKWGEVGKISNKKLRIFPLINQHPCSFLRTAVVLLCPNNIQVNFVTSDKLQLMWWNLWLGVAAVLILRWIVCSCTKCTQLSALIVVSVLLLISVLSRQEVGLGWTNLSVRPDHPRPSDCFLR